MNKNMDVPPAALVASPLIRCTAEVAHLNSSGPLPKRQTKRRQKKKPAPKTLRNSNTITVTVEVWNTDHRLKDASLLPIGAHSLLSPQIGIFLFQFIFYCKAKRKGKE